MTVISRRARLSGPVPSKPPSSLSSPTFSSRVASTLRIALLLHCFPSLASSLTTMSASTRATTRRSSSASSSAAAVARGQAHLLLPAALPPHATPLLTRSSSGPAQRRQLTGFSWSSPPSRRSSPSEASTSSSSSWSSSPPAVLCASPWCRDPGCGPVAPPPFVDDPSAADDDGTTLYCSVIGGEATPPPPPSIFVPAGLFQQRHLPPSRRRPPQLRAAAEAPFAGDGRSPPSSAQPSWDTMLRRLADSASALCVLDCTLLPLVTLGVSVLSASSSSVGAGGGSTTLLAWLLPALHELGHGLALWFVLPVGLLTALVNHASHRRATYTALSLLGLISVFVANGGGALLGIAAGGCLHHHAHGGHALAAASSSSTFAFLDHFFRAVQHSGALHRAVNLLGCGLLLASNALSKRASSCRNPDCEC